MQLLLHSCSHHSGAAGVHLALVCSRKLEGNCGNYSLFDTSGETLQFRLGRGRGTVGVGALLCSGTGLGWCSKSMNTMPLSLEHDGLGRYCSPVTAAWTMRAQNLGTSGVNMEETPCSSIPTMCAAGSTIHGQEELWMEMCCIWNLLPSSAEGLQEAQSQESCE